MRLLLLEDDELLGEGLRDFLQAEGHRVDWCRTLAQARALHGEAYGALLVDWQLPDGSGLDWLRQQRRQGDATPALMLTARDRLAQRIEGLDGGADDYLVKPFAPEELAARVRAVARRSAGSGSTQCRLAAAGAVPGAPGVPGVPVVPGAPGEDGAHGGAVGVDSGVVVDLAARSVKRHHALVVLTAREWAVLEALVLRAGRIVPKDALEQLVLGFESELASNALEVHISALRRKLGREAIETVRGLGYRVQLLSPR